MTLEAFVTSYGYPALFLSCLVEMEMVLIIAGMMAHNGYLALPLVMVIATCGSFCADQICFQIGRRSGSAFIAKRPHLEPRIDKVRRFLVRYQTIAILGYRFLSGTRATTPMVLGMSGFSTRSFVLLNICSTSLWAVTMSSCGFFFGHLVTELLENIKRYETPIILLLGLIAFAIWLWRRLRNRPPLIPPA